MHDLVILFSANQDVVQTGVQDIVELAMGDTYEEAVAAGKCMLERLSKFTNNFDENSILECADHIRETCASPFSEVNPIFLYKYALFFGIGQVSSQKFSFFLTDKWLSLSQED